MQKVKVYYNKSPHTSRVMTGFHMLNESNRIKLETIENTGNFRNISFNSIQAEINGMTITFDMNDRWGLSTKEGVDHLRSIDALFARSYTSDPSMRSEACEPIMNKVRPFGFDYYATYPGNPMNKKRSIKGQLIESVRRIAGYEKCMYVPYFEGIAEKKDNNLRILFMTRLWNPDDINPDEPNISQEMREYRQYMIEERHYINDQRIKIIRELKEKFGAYFHGGVFNDPFAAKICPDLILQKSQVRKKAYLDTMKSSDICIGSMGLHKSIGWKTGEYVAAARAIVAEQFAYEVPGNFDDGNHYIPFKTANECVEAVERLISDPHRVYEMKKANEIYYREYLKPDQQIINALNQIGIYL